MSEGGREGLRAPVRQRRTGPRREAVLDAALALYDEGGLAAVTATDLTRRARASVGSVYHHFGNLDGVLRALYQRELARYRDGALTALDDAGGEPRALVAGLVRHYLRWVTEHPASARLLFEQRFAAPLAPLDDDLRGGTQDFVRKVRARLAPALARGEVRRLPASLYAPLWLGPAQELCRLWLSGRTAGLATPVEAADVLADAAWQSLRSTEVAPAAAAR